MNMKKDYENKKNIIHKETIHNLNREFMININEFNETKGYCFGYFSIVDYNDRREI